MSFDPQVIRDSFELAKPIAGDIADKFYEFLFYDYPQSKGLFESIDMVTQKKALIGGLIYIVDNIEKPDRLKVFLENMGARHIDYNAEDEHYEWVGSSLLKTFDFFFQEKWTPELKKNWTEAYGAIAKMMIDGAARKRAWEAKRVA